MKKMILLLILCGAMAGQNALLFSMERKKAVVTAENIDLSLFSDEVRKKQNKPFFAADLLGEIISFMGDHTQVLNTAFKNKEVTKILNKHYFKDTPLRFTCSNRKDKNCELNPLKYLPNHKFIITHTRSNLEKYCKYFTGKKHEKQILGLRFKEELKNRPMQRSEKYRQMLAKLPNIEVIHYALQDGYLSKYTFEEIFLPLIKGFKNSLKELFFTEYTDKSFGMWQTILDKQIQTIVDNLPLLEKLQLVRCNSLTSKGYQHLTKLKNLYHLKLQYGVLSSGKS